MNDDPKNGVLVVREEWWYYGLWYVYPGKDYQCDWMAAIWKECAEPANPSLPWKGVYRFRYYASADPFDEKDKRSVYRLEAPGASDVSRLASGMEMIAELVTMKNRSKTDFIEVKDLGKKLTEKLWSGQYPWTHTRSEDSSQNHLWQ